MDNSEKILQQILENQLFMQNQINRIQENTDKMQNQISRIQENTDKMQNQINKMEEKIDFMDKKIDNMEVKMDDMEENQEVIKEFIFQSEASFRKTDEVYKVFQSVKNILVSEEQ